MGAGEQDLPLLSSLHNRSDVQIAFVYDRDRQAVGIDIAEILGIPRYHTPDHLTDVGRLDYVVVSEPRERFAAELEVLTRAGVKLINPSEVFQRLAPPVDVVVSAARKETTAPHTIDDTLGALEKLFDRKELLKFLLDVAVEATDSTAGSIMLYSPETKELYIGYAIGLSERVIKRTRQKLGEGIAGVVAQTKQPQLLNRPGESPHYADVHERVSIGSAISVPLIWGERLLGVLNVSVDNKGRRHDERDLERLKSLSRRISRVLERSVSLEAIQIRHRETKFRSTMDDIAVKSISTQEKISVLTRYLCDLIGADTVEIFLNTAEGDWFVLGGSNRLLSPKDTRVRYQSGALSRAFLEQRAIVLCEGPDAGAESFSAVSSVVYCPTQGNDPRGVIVVEFSERYRLDEFLTIRDAIVAEISRFLSSEERQRRLAREIRALRLVTDAASSILACRSAQNLAEILAATVGAALESERVSVRVRQGLSEDNYAESCFGVPPNELSDWTSEDHNRFVELAKRREVFSTAFLAFEPSIRGQDQRYRSVLAFPLQNEDGFFGGIIAYNKNPDDPLEDAIYSDLDRKILHNLSGLALPVLDAIFRRAPAAERGEAGAFDLAIAENLQRFRQMCADEVGRSDRYHHAFTVVLFRMKVLGVLLERDRRRALALAEDITQGLKTRTRRTDFGAWVRPDTYAILTLDGDKRIRFLVSRIVAYLTKDLSSLREIPEESRQITVGLAGYPGPCKTADDLLVEAEKNLKPIPLE